MKRTNKFEKLAAMAATRIRVADKILPNRKTFSHPLRSSREDRKGEKIMWRLFFHPGTGGENKRHGFLEEYIQKEELRVT